MEVPKKSGQHAPVTSASAKAPPPPSREPDPPPPDDDDDFDEAPTAMFVHPVKYSYDPDAPPDPFGVLDDEDDDDEDEPPTAIHISPYRGDAGAAPGMPGSTPQPAMQQAPRAPEAYPPSGQAPRAPMPQQAAPQQEAPQQGRQQPAMAGFSPPGVAGQPASAAATSGTNRRAMETQQLPIVRYAAGQATSMATPAGSTRAAFVDPDAAPVWLKAVALSSVVSALTVLGVLGWMLSSRF